MHDFDQQSTEFSNFSHLLFRISLSSAVPLVETPVFRNGVFAALLSTQLVTPGTLRRRGVAPVVLGFLDEFWSRDRGKPFLLGQIRTDDLFFKYIFVDFLRLLDP